MTRASVFAVSAAIGLLSISIAAQKHVAESKPVTVTATIEAIDPATRVVTLKGPDGNSVDVTAPEQVEGFKKLKVGDQVTATYYNAVAVQVRKPGAPVPSTEPSTTTSRKEFTPGSETRRQQTFSVTVESVDPAAPSGQGPEGARCDVRREGPQEPRECESGRYRGCDVLRVAADQDHQAKEIGAALQHSRPV